MKQDRKSPYRIWTEIHQYTKRNPYWIILVIAIVALFLRFWQLDAVPPGWRDDELINSLAISQKVIDGDLAVYYADASGHEALYHFFSAGTLALFGPGAAGIRWLPAILGTAAVVLTYLVASLLFGRKVALLASLTLAVSFWSLMYSRIGIRHISLPVFMLSSFYFFWRGLQESMRADDDKTGSAIDGAFSWRSTKWYALAGVFLGIGFYTYFASRGVPAILLLFGIYLALFQRETLKRSWRGWLLMLGLALILALPLIFTLMGQPETESRVEELAIPLVEARKGNLAPLGEHISRTLNMFHSDGDDEWLYNIPNRPLFGPILFRMGVSALSKSQPPAVLEQTPYLERAGAFVFIWWLVGISPGFISVPAASLGHTIIAQSAVYIIVAMPILPFGNWLQNRFPSKSARNGVMVAMVAGLLLFAILWRDLPDYFIEWPSRGMTRFLYRADIQELAMYLNDHEDYQDYAVTGLLAGPWDRLALEIDLKDLEHSSPRWYDPDRAVIIQLRGEPAMVFSGYPVRPSLREDLYQPVPGESAGGYTLARIEQPDDSPEEPICFSNGLCLLSAEYDPGLGTLDLVWQVSRELHLPLTPLISNPPPPGVYSGPRLSVFTQLLDSDGTFLIGDDGLWVDATGLMIGDRFLQQHRLSTPEGSEPSALMFGLYDPKTGERILILDGRDHIRVDLGE